MAYLDGLLAMEPAQMCQQLRGDIGKRTPWRGKKQRGKT
jgi:hypothetical protein